MCRYCRHPAVSEVISKVREEFDLDSVYAGNLKRCLKAVGWAIRDAKIERARLRRAGESSWAIDARLSSLQFGAWQLEMGRKDLKQGKTPHLNGYGRFIGGHKGEMFISGNWGRVCGSLTGDHTL